MSKARVTNVQTPGADATQQEPENPDTTTDALSTEPGQQSLPPDLQAIVDASVARALQAQRGTPTPVAAAPLPTQAEALEQVRNDPKRRSVLSQDGWVTHPEPVVNTPFHKA